MINITNKQRKNVWKPEILDNWNNLEYNVYERQGGQLIFKGNTNIVDDFEIDVTDWIEQYWNKQGDEGAFPFDGSLYIDVGDPDYPYGHSTESFSYDKNKTDLLSVERPDGVIIATAPASFEFPSPLYRKYNAVYIYPAYLLKIITSDLSPEDEGRVVALDTSFTKSMLGVESYNCNRFYEESTTSIIPGSDEYEDVMKGLLSEYNFTDVRGFGLQWEPVLLFDDGTALGMNDWYLSHPIFEYSNADTDYGSSPRFPVRFSKEKLDEIFENEYRDAVCDSISGTVEVLGYGFTFIYRIETSTASVGNSKNSIKTTFYLIGNDDSCPNMDLVFCNSDFKGKDENGRDVYDIRVPLQVHNGVLRGKTTNNISKTTWMNKYNDIHNSTATNTIELECYVDDEYLHTFTGNDKQYTQLMMVAQTARTTYLTGTAKISGLDMEDELTCLKCRVKDVEKVETYSKYNQSHPVPSLKITIEIYR